MWAAIFPSVSKNESPFADGNTVPQGDSNRQLQKRKESSNAWATEATTAADDCWQTIKLCQLNQWRVSQHMSVYLMAHTHAHTHNFPMEAVSHAQVGCYLSHCPGQHGLSAEQCPSTTGRVETFSFIPPSHSKTHNEAIPFYLRCHMNCCTWLYLPYRYDELPTVSTAGTSNNKFMKCSSLTGVGALLVQQEPYDVCDYWLNWHNNHRNKPQLWAVWLWHV